MFIYAYNKASEGAKALAEALGAKRIKHNNSKFKPGRGKVIINWGSSTIPDEYRVCHILNLPGSVAVVSNKLKFFELITDSDVRILEWTKDVEQARTWANEGSVIVERHVLQGHSGGGIRITDKALDIQRAPLYTKYVPKKDEYRIHFVGDKIIYAQQKKRRLDVADEDIDWQVRNHDNGFIYARENVIIPDDVTNQALATIKACGLDFGAVDIIYNKKQNQAYVLEVNSAPGLEGQSVIDYASAIKEYLDNA